MSEAQGSSESKKQKTEGAGMFDGLPPIFQLHPTKRSPSDAESSKEEPINEWKDADGEFLHPEHFYTQISTDGRYAYNFTFKCRLFVVDLVRHVWMELKQSEVGKRMTDIGSFRVIGPHTLLTMDSDAEEWTEHRDLSLLRLRPADGVFDRVVLQKADESGPVSVFVFTEITGGDTTVGRLVFFKDEGNVFQFCRLDVDRPAVLEPQRVVHEPLEFRHTNSQLSADGRLLHVTDGQHLADLYTYELEKKACPLGTPTGTGGTCT
ncbi:hypothetical protein M3Y99_00658500 [Aphelenchoides fujianensis]|nr:hypothetical protein M3Y99_00658500 [Aphelenchoides fujianensis]